EPAAVRAEGQGSDAVGGAGQGDRRLLRRPQSPTMNARDVPELDDAFPTRSPAADSQRQTVRAELYRANTAGERAARPEGPGGRRVEDNRMMPRADCDLPPARPEFRTGDLHLLRRQRQWTRR